MIRPSTYPKKHPKGTRHDGRRSIAVRFKPDEFEKVRSAAETADLSMSEFIRQAVLEVIGT